MSQDLPVSRSAYISFWSLVLIIDTEKGCHIYMEFISTAKLGDNALGRVRVSVRLFAYTLRAKPFYLRPWFLTEGSTLTMARLGFQVKVVGQRSRSNAKIVFWHHCYLPFRSKVKLKVKGHGQGEGKGHGSRSKVKVKFMARNGQY